jgi:hypothetical protein
VCFPPLKDSALLPAKGRNCIPIGIVESLPANLIEQSIVFQILILFSSFLKDVSLLPKPKIEIMNTHY